MADTPDIKKVGVTAVAPGNPTVGTAGTVTPSIATAAATGKPAVSLGVARPGIQGTTQLAKRPPAFRLQSNAQRRLTRYLKALIYGNYGVGKTYFAATAAEVPDMNDVLLISAESGDLTLEGEKKFESITMVTVGSFKQFGDIHEFLVQHCKAREAGDTQKLKELQARFAYDDDTSADDIEEPLRFRTVIIDSLTEIEALCMNQLLGISDSTRIDEETQNAEWTHFRSNHSQILRLIRQFRDLPMHVIFTASEQFIQDESKKMKYTPDMTGKLSKKIQGFMDMVGYYVRTVEGEKEVRKLYVVPSAQGKFDAKHRYSRFKKTHFIDPSVGSILKEVGLASGQGAELK